ncbi:MAG: hypothetical protein JAZ03_08560, partial [Candidatus Thiodiazotropha taylori]|nr:hypothetical protein [Candidatus Thiodiazotropha taylori]MCW4333976.1 hypothetical protein [Candidatus Thiodiazotropha endolucinida]
RFAFSFGTVKEAFQLSTFEFWDGFETAEQRLRCDNAFSVSNRFSQSNSSQSVSPFRPIIDPSETLSPFRPINSLIEHAL